MLSYCLLVMILCYAYSDIIYAIPHEGKVLTCASKRMVKVKDCMGSSSITEPQWQWTVFPLPPYLWLSFSKSKCQSWVTGWECLGQKLPLIAWNWTSFSKVALQHTNQCSCCMEVCYSCIAPVPSMKIIIIIKILTGTQNTIKGSMNKWYSEYCGRCSELDYLIGNTPRTWYLSQIHPGIVVDDGDVDAMFIVCCYTCMSVNCRAKAVKARSSPFSLHWSICFDVTGRRLYHPVRQVAITVSYYYYYY